MPKRKDEVVQLRQRSYMARRGYMHSEVINYHLSETTPNAKLRLITALYITMSEHAHGSNMPAAFGAVLCQNQARLLNRSSNQASTVYMTPEATNAECGRMVCEEHLMHSDKDFTNSRERWRQHNVNVAFYELRKHLPTYPLDKKLSKHEILRLATRYIAFLGRLVKRMDLERNGGASTEQVTFGRGRCESRCCCSSRANLSPGINFEEITVDSLTPRIKLDGRKEHLSTSTSSDMPRNELSVDGFSCYNSPTLRFCDCLPDIL